MELKKFFVLRPVEVTEITDIKKGELFYEEGQNTHWNKATSDGCAMINPEESYILSQPVEIIRKKLRG